jgi:hypothetical protein
MTFDKKKTTLHGRVFQLYKVVKYHGFGECGRSWTYQCCPLQLKNQITKHIALKSQLGVDK